MPGSLESVFAKTFDPIIQILRPVSPLAWLPLGSGAVPRCGQAGSELGALFTIAICAMWPTVLNTAVGVRAIPQDYLERGQGVEALAHQDALQSADSRDAALHVHRFPS